MKVLCIEGASVTEEDWDEFTIERAEEHLFGVSEEYSFEKLEFEDKLVIKAVEKVEGELFLFIW